MMRDTDTDIDTTTPVGTSTGDRITPGEFAEALGVPMAELARLRRLHGFPGVDADGTYAAAEVGPWIASYEQARRTFLQGQTTGRPKRKGRGLPLTRADLLKALHTEGPLTRRDIQRRCSPRGVSALTVAAIMQPMVDAGVVVMAHERSGRVVYVASPPTYFSASDLAPVTPSSLAGDTVTVAD